MRARANDRPLAGRKILILEDELLIALELSDVLRSFGAAVLGPAGRLDDARELIVAEPPDAAVLDVKLDGELSLPLARELAEAGVLVVVLTGYVRQHLPEGYGDFPLLAKPVNEQKLFDALLCGLADKAPPEDA
jgi:ActR/RegA family two-component response regulator